MPYGQKGIAHLFLILLLALGIGLGVYLIGQKTQLFPWAASDPISGPIITPSPPIETGLDSDNDGFTDFQEDFMGTDPIQACGVDAWPVDVNNDTYVNGGDVSALVPYINGTNAYNKRYDLNQDENISLGDVVIILQHWFGSCSSVPPTPPPTPSSPPPMPWPPVLPLPPSPPPDLRPSPSSIVTPAPVPNVPKAAIYEIYRKDNGNIHFYTPSKSEADGLVSTGDWLYQRIPWYAYSSQQQGTVPIYEIYRKDNGNIHFFSMDKNEIDGLVSTGDWLYQRIPWYAYPSQASGTIPVYEIYRKDNGNIHFYTADKTEADGLVKTGDWLYQRIAWYAYSS